MGLNIQLFLSTLLYLFLFSTCTTNEWTLSREKLDNYKIVVYDTHNVIQNTAAIELQHYLLKTYNKKVDIISKENIKEGNFFFLGYGFIQEQNIIHERISEQAIIKYYRNGNFFLSGNDSKIANLEKAFYRQKGKVNFGTLYATYDFLENDIGIKWFFPTELGEFVPRSESVVFTDKLIIETPFFNERSLNWNSLYFNNTDLMYWLLRNKITITNNLLYRHSWSRTIPTDEFYKTNPDIFAKVEGRSGKYITPINKRKGSAKLCTTNPETTKLFLDRISSFIDSDPSVEKISISPDDGTGFCQCSNCIALDKSNNVNEPSSKLSYRIFSFYKTISDSILKKYPNIELGGFAYGQYKYAPSNIALDERFHVRLALNSYGLTQNFELPVEIIESWKDKHKNIGFFSYPYGLWIYPIVATDRHSGIIRALVESNIRSAYFYFYPDWYNQGLDVWILTKLLWNPDTDVSELLDSYYKCVYPIANEIVKDFHMALHENGRNLKVELNSFQFSSTEDVAEMFSQLYPDELLSITSRNLSTILLNKSMGLNEKINVQNLLATIDFLTLEKKAYRQFQDKKTKISDTDKKEFGNKLNSLKKSLILTPESRFYDETASPSLYIRK